MADRVWNVRLLNCSCDRCGKEAAELIPFKLSDVIRYRGKPIKYPWLCVKCLVIEKEKWWGKKLKLSSGGRLLGDREWNEYPKEA